MSYILCLLHVLLGILISGLLIAVGVYLYEIDLAVLLYCYFEQTNFLNRTLKNLLTNDENV